MRLDLPAIALTIPDRLPDALSKLATDRRPREYRDEVTTIIAGDAIGVRSCGDILKVRLAEIDTPERDQPYGKYARRALGRLVGGKQVHLVEQCRERDGRIVARVYVDDVDVNAEMVRNGHAWVYRRFASDAGLFRLEREARNDKRGLWALPESQQVPSWQWRRAERNGDAG